MAARFPASQIQRCLTVVGLVLVAFGGVWLWWSYHLQQRVELWLHGEQPVQFYLTLEGDLLDDYSRVIAVAHNSGDRLATTREALDYGADVIEIDVVEVNGVLYAAHEPPPWFINRRVYRGPRLSAIWAAAGEADAVALDLKQTTPELLRLVVGFLRAHRERQVIVSTHDRASMELLAAQAPDAYRFLSVGSPRQLDRLRGDPELVELIDGVGIRESLVNDETAAWLIDRELLILAWTVNDIGRVNELVELGVAGITTDNLALMELLGGQERGDDPLADAAQRRP